MRTVLSAIAMLVAFVLAQAVALGLLSLIGVELDVDTKLGAGDALTLLVVQAVGVVFAAALIWLGPATWRGVAAARVPRGSFDAGWRMLLPVGIVVIGPTFMYAVVSDSSLLDAKVSVGSALAFAALAIGIAVNEELWFRGLIVERLEHARRPWLTVIAASALFGLPHVAATGASWLNAAAVTLVVGIPFVIVRLRCGSIWPLVAWHALIDLWAFLHTSSVVATGNPGLVEAVLALALPVLVACGYLVWFQRGQQHRIMR